MRAHRFRGVVVASLLCLLSGTVAAERAGGGRMGSGPRGAGPPGQLAAPQFRGTTLPRHGILRHRDHVHGHFAHGFRGTVPGVLWISEAPSYSYYSYVVPAPTYVNMWFYCASVGRYYPYVQVCPEGWVPVQPYPY